MSNRKRMSSEAMMPGRGRKSTRLSLPVKTMEPILETSDGVEKKEDVEKVGGASESSVEVAKKKERPAPPPIRRSLFVNHQKLDSILEEKPESKVTVRRVRGVKKDLEKIQKTSTKTSEASTIQKEDSDEDEKNQKTSKPEEGKEESTD